jgi:hypothetical protein
MKKSQLRNIIKESIKQLINEQSTGVYHRWQGQNNQNGNCKPSGIANIYDGGSNTPQTNHAFWQLTGSPQVGEFVKLGAPGNACWEYLGTNPSPQSTFFSYNWSLFTFDIHTNCSDCWVTTTSGCGACDSMNWSNYPTWVSTWTNNGAFQNTMQNANQPCNHICQKITQWTAMCATAGPNQQNILACKIAEGQNQATIHGCNC